MSFIRLNSFLVDKTKVKYYFDCSDELSHCFNGSRDENGNYCLFAEFEDDITKCPDSIIMLPFLGTVFGVAIRWNAKVELPKLDSENIMVYKELCSSFNRLYRLDSLSLDVSVGTFVDTDKRAETTEGGADALFFTGGLDATSALVQIMKTKPILLNVYGADINTSDAGAHSVLNDYLNTLNTRFGLKHSFIRSNCREIINENVLGNAYWEIIGPAFSDYWAAIAHIVVMSSVTVPLLWVRKITNVYFGSTYPDFYNKPGGSDKLIIDKLKFKNCNFTMLDTHTYRIDKVSIVREFAKQNEFYPTIHSCYRKKNGKNCNNCSKCYRTILDFVLNEEDPNKYGFEFKDEDIEDIKSFITYNPTNYAFVEDMQNYLIRRGLGRGGFEKFKWLIDYDPFAAAMWSPKDIDPSWNRIAIYGAGEAGRDYVKLIRPSWKIVLVVDREWEKIELSVDGYRVRNPKELADKNFDKVLIAIKDDKTREDVREKLISDYGIDEKKIYAEKPVRKFGGAKFLYFS